MLVLITGVPGSGKTLYAVGQVKNYLAEGRVVYADIDELHLPGVMQAPEDWRDCPDGSVVVYDECQQRFGPDGAGRSARADVQELETHRHRGMDIVLITQHPKLLHAHIRRLVGRHYHIFRMFGTESAKVFARDGQIDVDKPSALRDQDSFLWQFPKADYGSYKSATIHTHKRQLPAWLKRSGVMAGIFLCIALGFAYSAIGFFLGDVGEVKASPASPVQHQKQQDQVVGPIGGWVEVRNPIERAAENVTGCLVAPGHCVCIGAQGRVRMSAEQCVSVAAYIRE